MRKLKIGFFISINIAAIYLLGPHPEKPFFDDVLPYIPNQISIDDYVSKNESNFKIKANNEAKIIWADSSRLKDQGGRPDDA